MVGAAPLRYEATNTPICKGDVVAVPVGKGTMRGVVKKVWPAQRHVDVWLPATRLARLRVVMVRYRRADVSPLPWLNRRRAPYLIVEKAA